MAGTANTTRFMIGAATLMIGSQANLYNLSPTNSLGLVKNVTYSAEPTFLDLTQGPKNSLVYSALTGNAVKISAEVFEYTAQNITYGLSLDGTAVAQKTVQTTVGTGGIDGSPTPTTTVPVASSAGMNAGDFIMIDASNGTADDNVIVRKIASVTDGTHIVVGQAITVDVTAGALVTVVNSVDVGSTQNPAFLAAKIVGNLADGTPTVALFPKVRITKGMTMAFNSEQYGNLPFEMEVLDLVPSDTWYADFKTAKARLFTR